MRQKLSHHSSQFCRVFTAIAAMVFIGIAFIPASGSVIVAKTTQWVQVNPPTQASQLIPSDVSCFGTRCVAVGVFCGGSLECGGFLPGGIVYSNDAGATWLKGFVPSNAGNLQSVTCVSTLKCLAVGALNGPLGPTSSSYVLRTLNGGANWTMLTLSPNGLVAVSCPSATRCFVSGSNHLGTAGLLLATNDFGAHWAQLKVPKGLTQVNKLACPLISRCFALATTSKNARDLISTTDGGSTWKTISLSTSFKGVFNLTCPTESTCLAVGGTGPSNSNALVLQSRNSGASWKSESIPQRDGYLNAIFCRASGACLVAAGDLGGQNGHPTILSSSNYGQSWSLVSTPSQFGGLTGVSCSLTGSCVAVGSWWAYTGSSITSSGTELLRN
jgi:photosystem II stability/assembly factor-like uncharacterized protein